MQYHLVLRHSVRIPLGTTISLRETKLPQHAAMATNYASTSSRSSRSASNKRPGQELERSPVAQPSYHAAQHQQQQQQDAQVEPVPLKYVVQEAVKRWFEDTLLEAQRGDVKQQALVGQMYLEGYGCNKDPRAAKEWIDKANSRGYKMQGVYCEL